MCSLRKRNCVQGSLDPFFPTFLRAVNSCLVFFFSPSSCVLRHCACYILLCVCVYTPYHWVEVMRDEIYQSQWSIVMKALWGSFNHDYSQGPCKVVSFLLLFNENSPQLFWFTGSQYSVYLCCFYYQLNWPVPSTGKVAIIKNHLKVV